MVQAPGTPSSNSDEGRSHAGDAPHVNVRTDKKEYRAGESIFVAIENNSTNLIQYMGLCSLHLCQKAGEDWICVEQECDSPPIELKPGSQMDLVMEARAIVQGECRAERCSRYKLDFQVVSEDAIYFSHSEGFTVQSTGLNCGQARRIALEYAQLSPYWTSLDTTRAIVIWRDEDRACIVDFAWQGSGEIRPDLWSEGYCVVIGAKSGRVKEAYAYER
jgi:hypothetical protein